MIPDPEPITLAHGESVKRVFEIGGKIRGLGWLSGHLTVTDSRVIYRARAQHKLGASLIAHEMQVQDVAGASFVTRRGFTALSLLTLLIGTALAWFVVPMIVQAALTALAMATRSSGVYGSIEALMILSRILVLGIAVAIAIVRWRSTEVVFVILGKDVGSTPVGFYGRFGRQNPGLLAIAVVSAGGLLLRFMRWIGVMDATDAGDEADPARIKAMYEEFGALILDLQNRGVFSGE